MCIIGKQRIEGRRWKREFEVVGRWLWFGTDSTPVTSPEGYVVLTKKIKIKSKSETMDHRMDIHFISTHTALLTI